MSGRAEKTGDGCPESDGRLLLGGSEACVEGAIAAGVRFYAGYPITPATEVAEQMARRLPQAGGTFVQMEDEIASLGACIGARVAGAKAMTATSGPGFSLMQENIGYAVMAEVPVVVANFQRVGPSTGLPTKPAQGDVMQARWGTHGAPAMVVLCPGGVADMFQLTVRAVNISERFRTPVILLADEIVAHMREGVALPGSVGVFQPEVCEGFHAVGVSRVPCMKVFGDGTRPHYTGLVHGPDAMPSNEPEVQRELLTRLYEKLVGNEDLVWVHDEEHCDDARVIVFAYGAVARSSRAAVHMAREKGMKAGLMVPKTLWPFPTHALGGLPGSVRHIVVPEMNMGQLEYEVRATVGDHIRVSGLHRVDGDVHSPHEIYRAIAEAAK